MAPFRRPAATPAPLVSVASSSIAIRAKACRTAVSLSLRLTFQAPDRTLTDAEVQQSVDSDSRGAAYGARRGAAIDDGQLVMIVMSSQMTMANSTATRSVDLEPIDRLEEKVKLLVGWSSG